MNNKFKNFKDKERNMVREQILTPELLAPNSITPVSSAETDSITVSDPNNIVQKTFEELEKLPQPVLEALGEVTINIGYQLVPNVQVTLKK